MDNIKNTLANVKAGIAGTASSTWEKVTESAKSIGRRIVDTAGESVKKVVSGVNNIAPNMLPTATATLAELSFRGNQSSFSALLRPIRLVSKTLPIAGSNARKFGYPACKSRPPQNLTGFCLTQNAMFEISGTIEEEQALEELFNKGVILDWSD